MVGPRISHEKLVLDRLAGALGSLLGVTVHRGLGANNRFVVDGWQLEPHQAFQFGDFRLEAPGLDLVVETESGGGVTNLAKYWPLLAAKRPRRFVLVHLFQVLSRSDYVSHLALWDWLVERMREDLERRCGVLWLRDWEARRFVYGRSIDTVPEVVSYIHSMLKLGSQHGR